MRVCVCVCVVVVGEGGERVAVGGSAGWLGRCRSACTDEGFLSSILCLARAPSLSLRIYTHAPLPLALTCTHTLTHSPSNPLAHSLTD